MPGWPRRPDRDATTDSPPTPPSPPPELAQIGALAASPRISGNQPCTRVGCSATNAVPCAYVDRRGSTCATAWCPDDQVVVGGEPYCPRHGRVVRVLQIEGLSADPLPDVDNRAASLVDFIAESMGPAVGNALHSAWPGDLSLGGQNLSVQYAQPGRRRVWTRKWTLHSHTGTEVSVAFVVAEDRDHELIVNVDSQTVTELVPPWIANRPSADDATRDAFYAAVVEAVRAAVANAHARSLERMLRTDRPLSPPAA
jgi:hypothetical protein